MCISCGCGRFEDSHNDERNITVAALRRASDASNVPFEDVLRAMQDGCRQMIERGAPEHQSAGQAVNERLRDD